MKYILNKISFLLKAHLKFIFLQNVDHVHCNLFIVYHFKVGYDIFLSILVLVPGRKYDVT